MRAPRSIVWIALVSLAAAGGCAPTTRMLTSWSAPDFRQGSVEKVLVLAVARDVSIRRSYEDTFVRTLEKHGYAAVPSYLWIPEMPKELDKALIAQKVKENGVTHVLATRLVDQKTVRTYTPPSYATVGVAPYYPGWYGSYYSYWSVGYSTVMTPGSVTEEQVVSLETNLYDASEEKLIWTGITETWISSTPSQNVDAVIDKVVYELRAKGIL